jgi:DHA2 family multidrug resistance protein
LKEKDPVVDLSLLKDRNFGISALLMFMVGVVLLGSTVLIPQYMQLIMGYSATQAGLVISPGGVLVMLLLPMVGILLGKFEARWLIGFGLAITSAALIHMTNFNNDMDFKYAMWARCFQAAGLAFLFVPINTAAYRFVPRDKNNAASGLINLARNVGGSVGISLVTTILSRRAQFHQARLTEQTAAWNPAFNRAVASAGHAIGVTGDAATPYALLLREIQRQAQTLSYIDCFWILGVVFGLLTPLVFFMKKASPGRAAAAH